MDVAQLADHLNVAWLLIAAAIVFFMQVGFTALEAGVTRRKNNINVAAKNLVDFGIAVALFWLFGFGLMFGQSGGDLGLFGSTLFSPDLLGNLSTATSIPVNMAAFFIFQAVCCGTAVTIISGASAERMRFESYLIVSVIVSGLIYPFFGHWAWGGLYRGIADGWLSSRGFVDFAGSTVVHSVGGWAALAVIIILKPRIGRFTVDGRPIEMAQANLPLATLGGFMLWFGWFGFNGGSTLLTNGNAGIVIANTILAGAAGLVAVIPIGMLNRKGIIQVDMLINGALAGLVSITACAHAVHAQQAFVIGFIAAWIMTGLSWLLLRLRLDDAVGAVPVHLGAGIWGALAVALFGDPAVLGTGLNFIDQLTMQAIGILAAGVWGFMLTIVCLNTINSFFPLRVTPAEEIVGLNISEQGALPDFSEFPGLQELLKTNGSYESAQHEPAQNGTRPSETHQAPSAITTPNQ